MSQQIENQIVKMQFDNGSFEKNCKESMSTLDKLKKALKFDKVDMSPLQNDMDKLNMDKIEQSCDAVTKKFSLFGTIADQIVRDLTSKFVDMGEKMVKSFTIDQVAEGWSKYAQKTEAIQTIMANTVKNVGEGLKWKDQEEQMEAVTKQIEKMNWYTDETSYSLTDMTNNLGKFLAQGVELEEATDAMMGISSWAAISGQKKAQAEMAMYNLSQALGAGAVKAIDWKSIENANMATEEFKQTVIETAKELGVLDKETNEIFEEYITAKKYNGPAEVSTKNFRETLSAGWFNGDVLMKSLEKYGGFATKINELYNTVNREGMVSTTSALLKTLENVKNGAAGVTEEIGKIAKSADMEYEDLKFMFDELAKPEYDLGRRAFAAAQEAKTFQEAIEATSDAVASEWMGIFEAIFGNYLEAKELWTDLANSLWDIFAGPLDNIKWALMEWKTAETEVYDASEGTYKKMAGREMLLQAICNIINNIGEALEVVRSALAEVFPIWSVFVTEGDEAFDTSEASNGILMFTKRLYEFSQSLKLSEDAANTLHTVVKLLATTIKVAFTVIGGVFQGVIKLVKPVFNIIDAIFGLIGKVISAITGNESLGNFADKINSGADSIKNNYLKVMDKIADVLNKIADAIRSIPDLGIGKKIGAGFKAGVAYVEAFWREFKEMPVVKQMVDDFNASVAKIEAKVRPLGATVKQTLSGIKTDMKATINWETFNKYLTIVYDKLKKGFALIKEFGGKIKNFFKDLREGKSVVESFKDNFSEIINYFTELKDKIVDFFDSVFAKGDELGQKFNLADIQKAIHEFVANITPEQITMIAIAGTFLIIALNLLKLSEALKNAAEAFTGIGLAIKNVINSYIKKQKSTILQVAEAIVIVAAALWVLSTVPKDKLENAIDAIITLTGCLVVLTGALSAAGILLYKFGGKDKAKSLVEMAAGLAIVAGALMTAALTLKVLENVDLKGVFPKILVIGGILVGLVALSVLMSKLDKFKTGSITMIVAAGAMLLVAEAMARVGAIPAERIQSSMDIMYKLMIGLAAITFAAGKVGIFSAVGLIAIVLTIEKIMPAIEKIVNYDYSTINSGMEKNQDMLKKLGGLILVMTGIGMLAGNRIKGAGIAMLSVAASFAIMVGIAKLAGKMRPSELRQGESFLIKMAGIIALIELCSTKSKVGMWGGKAGGEGSKAFIKIAVAMGILLGVAKLASMMKPADLVKGELAVLGLVAIVGAMVIAAKNASKSEGVIKSIASMLVGISIVLGLVALLSMIPLKNMAPALGAVLAIILSLSLLAKMIANSADLDKGKKMNLGGVLSLVSAIAVVCALGYFVSEMAKQPIKNVAASALAMVSIITAVSVLMKSLSKIDKIDKAAFTAASEALIVVVVLSAILGAISWFMTTLKISPETMLSAASAISMVMLGITPALAVLGTFKGSTSNYEKMKKSVIGVMAILAEVAIAIGLLSNFGGDSNKMIASAVAIAIGLIAVCAPITVLGAVGKFIQKSQLGGLQKVIIGAIELLAGVAMAIIAVSRFSDSNSIIQSATALAIGLVAISVPIAVLGAVGKFCSRIGSGGLAAMGVSIIGSIVALGAIAAILIWFASSVDAAQVAVLNDAIPALVVAIAGVGVLALAIVGAGLLSGGGAAIGPGMAAIVAAIAAMGIIIAAIAGLGAIMNYYGVGADNALEKGLDTVVLIAGKLGEAAGALIGGIGTGLASKLDKIGDDLNSFGDKMRTFGDKMAGFGTEAVTGCKNLAEAMLFLTAAEFIEGIGSLVGVSFVNLDFASLGGAVAAFAASVKNLSEESISKAVVCSTIAKTLAQVSTTFENKGGLAGLIFGEKESLTEFGDGIRAFGLAILRFCNAVQTLPSNAVELAQNAADAASPIVDLSKTLVSQGGLIQQIMGEKDLAKFGTNMASFANGLRIFVMRLLDIEKINPAYVDSIKNCADATGPMIDLANGLENSGGTLAKLVGDNTLDSFGATLIPFANSLRIFVNRLNSMASEVPNYVELITSSVACSKLLVELANNLENMGGAGSWFEGDNTLDRFGEKLEAFGGSLQVYSASLGEVDVSAITNANSAITELVNIGSLASGIAADAFNGLATAIQSISTLPIATISNEVTTNTPVLTTAYTTMFTTLTTLINTRITTDTPTFVKYGKSIMDGIKTGIATNTVWVSLAITTMITTIRTKLGEFTTPSKYEGYGRNITNGISTGIAAGSQAAAQTAWYAGSNIVNGLKKGIDENAHKAIQAAKDMVTAINAEIEKREEIQSPSRVMARYGKYIALGMAKGISDYTYTAVGSTTAMAEDIVVVANDIIDQIAAAIDSNIDTDPVIRPVLDTSDIEYKASHVGQLFNSSDLALAYTASGSIQSMNAAKYASSAEPVKTNNGEIMPNTINFTQNNYSPKELSRMDIYRQTKNQLNMMKGVIKSNA